MTDKLAEKNIFVRKLCRLEDVRSADLNDYESARRER